MPVDAGADIRPLRILKQRTLVAHRELEDRLDLLSPQLDLGRYRRLLRGFASVYGPLERRVDGELDRHGREPGALHVTEGATLGGVLISRHLVHRFRPDVPHAFFRSYGRDVPARWAEYRRVVVLRTAEDVDIAASTALATFAALQLVLVP